MFMRILILSIACLFCSACAYLPQLQTPQISLPEYAEQSDLKLAERPDSHWWQRYGSADLELLITALHQDNLDLLTARARIERAGALLAQQGAANWPSVSAQLASRNSRDLEHGDSAHGSSLDFGLAYTVDLWGSRSAAEYGAELAVIAQQEIYQGQMLVLQSTLAQTYFQLLTLRERHLIAQKNLEASESLLELIQWRFEAGIASGIELNQQRNTLLSTRAQLLDLERALSATERALAVLLGRGRLDLPQLSGTFADLTLPEVSLMQPASLLEYRPDIRLAEVLWRSDEASLFEARMQRWPSLNLSAGLGLDDVLNGGGSWLASLASSLGAPLFDAGRIRAQIEAAESDLSISEINYRLAVLLAMQETLEALDDLSFQQRLLDVRREALVNNEQLYELASLRYDSGDTDFVNLLIAQRSWFDAQDSLVQTRYLQLLATVNMFSAMGISPQTEADR